MAANGSTDRCRRVLGLSRPRLARLGIRPAASGDLAALPTTFGWLVTIGVELPRGGNALEFRAAEARVT